MKKIKERKGITLIALVITIIILLILAGITIALLTDENGLFKRAMQAKERTEIESAREEIEIAIMEEEIRAQTGENLGNEFKYENVWDELRKNDKNLKVTEKTEEGSYELEYKGYLFEIDKNRNVTYLGKKGKETKEEETKYTIIYNKNDGSGETIEQEVEKGTKTQ